MGEMMRQFKSDSEIAEAFGIEQGEETSGILDPSKFYTDVSAPYGDKTVCVVCLANAIMELALKKYPGS